MIVMVTGGQRSGKSSFALKLALNYPPPRLFVATAQPLDKEMQMRIERHKGERIGKFRTIEEPLYVDRVIKDASLYNVVVVDCLTLWVSNILMNDLQDSWEGMVDAVISSAAGKNCIFVSNEVGMGIVPDNILGRRFIDLLGMVNRRMVEAADEFYFLVSGLSIRLKPQMG